MKGNSNGQVWLEGIWAVSYQEKSSRNIMTGGKGGMTA